MIVDICIWGKCDAAPSTRISAPLCDHHAVRVYREVAALMREAPRPPLVKPALPSKARRNTKQVVGVIYYARFGAFIKVGFTTNLAQRMKDLRPDELLATEPGTMRDEAALHHRFGQLWVEREMFVPGPELMAHINGLRRVS